MKNQLRISSLISSLLIFCSNACYAATPENITKGHTLILKFFASMLGVVVSALVIWIVLKLYKKFVFKANSKLDNTDYNTTLESPKDFQEAINLFLDKTDR